MSEFCTTGPAGDITKHVFSRRTCHRNNSWHFLQIKRFRRVYRLLLPFAAVCCYRLLLVCKFAGDTVVAPVAGCVISVVPAIVLIVQVAQFTAGALTGCINTAASPTPNVTPFLSPLSLINRMRFLSAFLWSARGRRTVNFYCFLKMAFSTDSSGQPLETIHSFPLFGH